MDATYAIYLNIAVSGVTAWFGYRIKAQALRNELEIARLHLCLHEAVMTRDVMHAENRPVMLETLAVVNGIKATQDGE